MLEQIDLAYHTDFTTIIERKRLLIWQLRTVTSTRATKRREQRLQR